MPSSHTAVERTETPVRIVAVSQQQRKTFRYGWTMGYLLFYRGILHRAMTSYVVEVAASVIHYVIIILHLVQYLVNAVRHFGLFAENVS